jgi:twinkle protein
MTCPVCSESRKKKSDKCFSYNALKGAGRCNHCDIVLVEKKEFIKKTTKIEYKLPLFKNNTKYSDNVRKFFESRKISEKTLFALRVTESVEWMPKANKETTAINFNYFRNGELVNVKYRGAGKDFKLSKDAELIFYNLDCTITNDVIIIVEGEMDCLAMYEAGFKNVISVPNGAGLGKINFDYIDNCIDSFGNDTKYILAVDNDKAGQNLQTELARRLGFENCSKVVFKDCKDANDCLIKYGIQGIIESVADKKEFPIVGAFQAVDFLDNIFKYYREGLPKGCGIAMDGFDELLKFHEGYFTIITGIPGHGKSEVLDMILVRLNLIHGWKHAIFSPENHPLELHFSKFAEKIIGKSFDGAYRMDETDLNMAIDNINVNYFFIKPEEDFSLDNILATVKMLVRRKGIKSFVIDAWNKLDHKYSDNETKYISRELDKIAIFCEKYHVHGFIVAHPTKIQKDKTTNIYEVPNLYNINGSANFFNKTSNGITVYRNSISKKSEIHVQKVKFKHWGATGLCEWNWNFKNGRYFAEVEDNTNWLIRNPTTSMYEDSGTYPPRDYATLGEDINFKDLDINPF